MTHFQIEGDFFAVLSTALNHAILQAAQGQPLSPHKQAWSEIVNALHAAILALESIIKEK